MAFDLVGQWAEKSVAQTVHWLADWRVHHWVVTMAGKLAVQMGLRWVE